jgi:hypothetical protein
MSTSDTSQAKRYARAEIVNDSLNKTLGLLDAAQAEIGLLFNDEHVEANRNYLTSVWGGIQNERNHVAEYCRANQELREGFVAPEQFQPYDEPTYQP